jgi:hypothetical protein
MINLHPVRLLLSAVVQCFSLITKQPPPAYKPQKQPAEQGAFVYAGAPGVDEELKITSLDELKTKVGHVIVMILLVKMFERSKMVTIATGLDLLSYSICIFLSSASLYILHMLHKGDPED